MARRIRAACVGLFLGMTAADSVGAVDVVVVMSATSPTVTLNGDQIGAIFLGKSVRLANGAIAVPIDLADGSAERTTFYTKYAGKTPAQMKMHWSKLVFTGRGHPPRQVSDAEDLKKLLADNPTAISYIDASLVDDTLTVIADY